MTNAKVVGRSTSLTQEATRGRDLRPRYQELLDGPVPLRGSADPVITFSVGASHKATEWTPRSTDWREFARRATTHRVGDKAGSAWCPATFESNSRSGTGALQVCVAVLDSDKGQPLDEIRRFIERAGYSAAISSSYSHNTNELSIRVQKWEHWLQHNPGSTPEDYMLVNGYRSDVVAGACFLTTDGRRVIHKDEDGEPCLTIRHSPCPKYRIIFPALNPWKASYGADCYTLGLKNIANEIGLDYDVKATDVAHLFFDPRCSSEVVPESLILAGSLIDPWTPRSAISVARQNVETVQDDPLSAFKEWWRKERKSRLPKLTPEEVTKIVTHIRNDGRFSDFPKFIGVIGAIAQVFAKNKEGLDLACRWAATWTGGDDDPEENRKIYNQAHWPPRPGDTTIGTLIFYARRDGYAAPVHLASLENDANPLQASLFVWQDPKTLKPRDWLYGSHLIRKFLSCTSAPGGLGKSSLALTEAVAMVTGRDLLGCRVHGGPHRVWYWNGEDPIDEINRRVLAIAMRYDLDPGDFGDRLFVNSGRDCEVILAVPSREGTVIAEPVEHALTSTIKANAIDVVVLDPFVSIHMVNENDNVAINAVCKVLGRIANEAGCAIDLIHHSSKLNGVEATVEHARGASALLNAVRSARVLNRLAEKEASEFGIQKDERRSYIRVDNGKGNLAPTEKATWIHLKSVRLPNGDSVGVVEPCVMQRRSVDLSNSDIAKIQDAVDFGSYRAHISADDWVGHVIAPGLDLDSSNPVDKAYINKVVNHLLLSDHLRIVQKQDKRRVMKPFIVTGVRIETQ